MKFLGHGLGLRSSFMNLAMEGKVRVDWFEAITENYLGMTGFPEGPALARLLKVREHYPVVLHGVSLSIGSSDPLDKTYLERVRQLSDRVKPEWVSDHLCWTSLGGHNLHDLLPLRYSRDVLQLVCDKISEAQEILGRRLMFENVSSYVSFRGDEMPEWEFVAEVARRTGCALLLDVNNVFVSARNHGFDPIAYLDAIPRGAVGQMHLAGPKEKNGIFIDTHDAPVRDEVWELYTRALDRFGLVSTLVEWDAKLPPLEELEREVAKAKSIASAWKEKKNGLGQLAAQL